MKIRDYRQKIYYSKNEIVTNLFTNGRQFMRLRDFSEYVGFYHRYTTGEVFTENEWFPEKSERLIRFKNLSEPVKSYYGIKHFRKGSGNNIGVRRKIKGITDEYYNFTAPRPVKRKLTDKEIENGKTQRYFVTKRNERDRVFFEIGLDQVVTYNSSKAGINQYLYEVIIIPWKVDGPEYDIYDGDMLIMPGVIDTNLRVIDRYSKQYRLLRQLVQNPRELTVYENEIPSSIKNQTVINKSVNQPEPVVQKSIIPELPNISAEDNGIAPPSFRDGEFGQMMQNESNANNISIKPVINGVKLILDGDELY